MLGPLLKGSLVTLAPIAPEHLPTFCRWLAEPEVTQFLSHQNPYTLKEEEAWFEAITHSERDVIWGISVQDTLVGSTGITGIDWRNRRGTTGILIGDRSWWGRGVAGDAMRVRSRYAFVELGLEKLVTYVNEGNVASRRALERAGYQTVGLLRHHEWLHGQWSDVWIGELLREMWLAQQSA